MYCTWKDLWNDKDDLLRSNLGMSTNLFCVWFLYVVKSSTSLQNEKDPYRPLRNFLSLVLARARPKECGSRPRHYMVSAHAKAFGKNKMRLRFPQVNSGKLLCPPPWFHFSAATFPPSYHFKCPSSFSAKFPHEMTLAIWSGQKIATSRMVNLAEFPKKVEPGVEKSITFEKKR